MSYQFDIIELFFNMPELRIYQVPMIHLWKIRNTSIMINYIREFLNYGYAGFMLDEIRCRPKNMNTVRSKISHIICT